MKHYRDVLDDADRHFSETIQAQPEQMQCGKGCSSCCYGLFEVSSSDVALLVDALEALPTQQQSALIERALKIVESSQHPNIREIDEDEKDAFFDRTSATPCPALSSEGACQIYENRPLVCRTFGLPIRDGSTYIGDICDLNFKSATKPSLFKAAWDLQNEDPVSPDDQYTIPEAILIAARMLNIR